MTNQGLVDLEMFILPGLLFSLEIKKYIFWLGLLYPRRLQKPLSKSYVDMGNLDFKLAILQLFAILSLLTGSIVYEMQALDWPNSCLCCHSKEYNFAAFRTRPFISF